jgi:hypothetical protein
LVFSTGGVAIVGRADPTASSQPADPKQLPPAKPLPDQCSVTPRSQRVLGARPRVKRDAKSDAKPATVVLNGRGYNYANMGESQSVPAASAPPAAPAETEAK